jgi:dolichol-phosphate mannosyltransferase
VNSAAATRSVSIIVPTRNEAENIVPLIERIAATGVGFREIIFVDNNSNDGTREVISSLVNAKPIRLVEQNQAEPGLAAAIMVGAQSATGDLLLVMDADLSHPPEKIGDLLAPLLVNEADLVIGSRYIRGGSTPDWPLWRKVLSRTGSALAQPITGVRDSMCGFFAIERARLLQLAPPTIGFKIAFEIIARSGPSLRVREIPIAFRDRVRGKSKMSLAIALRFLLRWIAAIFRRGFSARHRAGGAGR